MSWHSKTIENVLSHFGTNPEVGLNDKDVLENKEKYGSNEFITQKPKPALVLLFEQFNDPVIYILIAAAILTIVVGHPKDAIVIFAVVILNTLIGFFQERKAADAIKALRKMASPNAVVIRNGNKQTIKTTELVCGDIVLLESGVRDRKSVV